MSPHSTRAKVGRASSWLISLAAFVFVAGGTVSVFAGIAADGITPRARGFLIGLGLVPAALVGISIAFRACVATARDRVGSMVGVPDVFMLFWSGTFERAFRVLGILPIWRVRLFAVSIGPSGLTFWSGIRRPFVFARISRANLVKVNTESVGFLGQPQQRVSVDVRANRGGTVGLAFEPLTIGRLIVAQGRQRETQRLYEALHRELG